MRENKKLFFVLLTGIIAITALLVFKHRYNSINSDISKYGRPSYTIKQIDEGVLGNKIVFNTISNSVVGDEKNFVSVREDTGVKAGPDTIWNDDITVEDGKEYLIRLYVHNNSPLGYDAIAENVRVSFSIPTNTAKEIPVYGYLYCDNATPSEYWDGVLFQSDIPFHLEYIYGSALIENKGYASKQNGGASLSDEIVTAAASNHGVNIGYNQEGDGLIPGGNQYVCYISIRVKAIFDSEYLIEQHVRLSGTSGWSQAIEANIGDEIEFQMEYRNISENTQRDVMIRDILPLNMEYIPGSTILYNSNYKHGAVFTTDDIITTGVNIGHYASEANAYIRFKAKIVDINLAEGSNTLVNWSQCSVGYKTIQDYATVTLYKSEN